MLLHAVADKHLQARTVLLDSWSAGADNLKLIYRLGLIFFTTLKENRLLSLSKEEGYLPELKQLTGTEKYQHLHRNADAVQVCRKARSQRTHLACCYHAWLPLKVKAKQLNKTVYQVKTDLLRDYLRAELRNPDMPAFQPA